MKSYVLTEGPSDAVLVERVLRGRVASEPEVVAGGGRSSVVSLAKSILLSRPAVVAILLDADTLDPARVLGQETEWSDLLRATSNQRRFRFVQAVPEIEVVLFESAVRWEELLGRPLEEWGVNQSDALVRPREALRRILGHAQIGTREVLFDRLDAQSIESMADHRMFREIITFLHHPSKRHFPDVA